MAGTMRLFADARFYLKNPTISDRFCSIYGNEEICLFTQPPNPHWLSRWYSSSSFTWKN